MGKTQTFEQKVASFWSKVNKNGPVPPSHPGMSNCWIWQVTEVKVEELRKALLKIESQAPVKADEETKKLEVPPAKSKKEEKPLPPDLPEEVKRTQKLIETIHARREQRARLVAEKLRRGVEIEAELRQAAKDRDAHLEAVEAKAREDLAAIAGAFQDLGRERQAELEARDVQIEKLDLSIEQLSKQLDAEVAKLTGRKVTA